MAGFDALDPVSIQADATDYASALYRNTGGLRLGVPRQPFYEALDPDIAAAVDAALEVLSDLTAGTRDVTLPPVPDFGVILAEGYAYHERYLADAVNRELYDPVTRERLEAAGRVPAATYINVRRELDLVRTAIAQVFADVDLLITPTTMRLPEPIERAQNPAQASGAEVSVRNTAPFNIYGIPTISVPCGFSASGLPIGLQISGPRLDEVSVLALAHAYEQATEWHKRRPPLA
jgi:aspartyl-tRNA(Asn)/glutamyl-tRNA(Gln) amidotransferase subunit A